MEEDWVSWFLIILFVQSWDFFDVKANFAQVVERAIQISESWYSGTRKLCERMGSETIDGVQFLRGMNALLSSGLERRLVGKRSLNGKVS